MTYININFPPQFSIISLKKKNNKKTFFYCYNKKYYFKFSLKNGYLDPNLNSVIMLNDEKKINFFYKNFYRNFIKSLDCYFYMKIEFKGKGYKVKYKKRRKKITFFFWSFSHIYNQVQRCYFKKICKI